MVANRVLSMELTMKTIAQYKKILAKNIPAILLVLLGIVAWGMIYHNSIINDLLLTENEN